MVDRAKALFDHFRYQVKARFHLRCDRLEQVALIGFGHDIGTQPLHDILGVGHGGDCCRIHCLHLLDKAENPR